MKEVEQKILVLLEKQSLITTTELSKILGDSDGVDTALARLRQEGFIKKIESLGTCWVITKKGLDVVKNLSP